MVSVVKKQVDKSHYNFAKYMSKSRWASVWHQLDELIAVAPARVLEIGPGPGTLKAAGACFGLNIETLDLDPDLSPDYVEAAQSMSFNDDEFDVSCAFQMLEHVPYEIAQQIFEEMARVSNGHVIISLPDSKILWPYSVYIPRLGRRNFFIKRPFSNSREHEFNGEHYWEINKQGYPLDRLITTFEKKGNTSLLYTYRVPENPYHRFLVFERP